MALARCAQAWAYIHQRDFVLPEDVQAILPSVINHRVVIHNRFSEQKNLASTLLLKQVPVIDNL